MQRMNPAYSESEDSAKSAASRLLTNVNLKAYVEERLKEIDSKRIMSAKEALELLTSIARGETREEVIVSFEGGLDSLPLLLSLYFL